MKVEGQEIIVVDDCLKPKKIEELYQFFENSEHWHREHGTGDLAYWHLATDFPPHEVRNDTPFKEMRALVDKHFPKEKLAPYRAYCNLTKYGDQTTAHRDCFDPERDVTCLYYVNPIWHGNWGGETLFYNNRGDTEAVIAPIPGRIALFRGVISHRGAVPTRASPVSRYCLAYKFKREPTTNGAKSRK